MKKTLFCTVLALAAAQTFAATKLRFAHAHPESDSQHKAAQFFADEVKQQSNGELQVVIYANGQLGNDQAMIDGVRSGTIDIELSGNPYFTGMVAELNALDIPFLFADEKEAYSILDGDIGRGLLDKLGEHQLQGLAFWEIGFRQLTNNARAVKSADDIAGLKLRTTPNPVHLAFFRGLGANPVPMPFAEVYTSLETRTIDGQENPVNLIHAANLQSVQKYLSLTAHAYTAAPLVMNRAKFAALTPEQQTILLDAARKAADFQRQMNAEQQASNLQALKSAGMMVEENPDRDAMRHAAQAQVDKVVAENGLADMLQTIRSALAKP